MIRFSELWADTARVHGVQWAAAYYRRHAKMELWEALMWVRITGGYHA
jgi:hypothetical protein